MRFPELVAECGYPRGFPYGNIITRRHLDFKRIGSGNPLPEEAETLSDTLAGSLSGVRQGAFTPDTFPHH
jgi:hypothetical protein